MSFKSKVIPWEFIISCSDCFSITIRIVPLVVLSGKIRSLGAVANIKGYVISQIHDNNSPYSLEPFLVGHQNYRQPEKVKIFRGSEPNHLLSTVMSAQLVVDFCSIKDLNGVNTGLESSCVQKNGIWKINDNRKGLRLRCAK